MSADVMGRRRVASYFGHVSERPFMRSTPASAEHVAAFKKGRKVAAAIDGKGDD